MGRTLKNTLIEAEMLENLVAGFDNDPGAMARYGADLLGRAIGHEQRHERCIGLAPTMWYSNLLHQLLPGQPHASRRIMAFGAAREVMAI